MIALVLVAFMAVLGILIMMGRLNLRRFLGYPNVVDIACSILFLVLFAGTFSGMVVAGFASLFMSLMLWVLRSILGAERLAVRYEQRKRGPFSVNVPVWYWQTIRPQDCQPHWLTKLWASPKAAKPAQSWRAPNTGHAI